MRKLLRQLARQAPPDLRYRDRLNAMWERHLAPRAEGAPTVVSTFAGCGGSSLGYSMAGYRELLAVEWDANAVACFRANFPEVPVYHGDIAALSVEEVLRLTGLRPGELDVFDGSPPCQGFSTAGKRDFADPRNQLFREYVRLLNGLQPRVFVMENVSGMVKGDMKLIFAEVLTELRGCGYRVTARLMNAAFFGVPQARQRMIFVGVRNDLEMEPVHPRAETAPMPLKLAIPEMLASRSQRINPWMPAEGPAATICKMGAGYEVLALPASSVPPREPVLGVDGLPVEHPAPPRLTPKYRALAPRIRIGECAADHDPGKGFQNLVRVDPERPSPTLTKMNPGNGRGTPLHPYEHRSLSIEEAKRIGSFPDAFRLVGPFADQWARIGNSVPPLLMEAVARTIRERLLAR